MFRAKRALKVVALVLPLLSMAVSTRVSAESESRSESQSESESKSEVTRLDDLRVTGMQEEELNQSIAPKRVGKEVLESSRATDVGRALRNVPGVYVRDEEGQGLRPNIGLRGTNPDRSKKVVIMEDEILSGPAPYSAPAAYYTPPLSLAEELEIFRGFSAMAYGPNSIGGAVNYVGYPVPQKKTRWLDVGYGSYNSVNLKGSVGDKTSWGGYLLQFSRISSDGFKKLDTKEFTGFYRDDVKMKIKYDLPEIDGRVQSLGFQYGYGDEDSHETYLGISSDDFEETPYRRYSSSALDEMKWHRHQLQAEYMRQTSETGVVKATAYRHEYSRVWYRFDRFRGSQTTVKSVFEEPAKGVNPIYHGILSGARDSSDAGLTDGQLVLASNDRVFLSQGLQINWGDDFRTGELKQRLKLLARFHQDQIDREHTFDYYAMTAGRLVRTNDPRQLDKNNREWTLATSLSLQDDLEWGPWVLTLVGRLEKADFVFRDNVVSTENKRSDSYLAPGAGLLYRINASWSSKISVNRAVTIAGLDPSGKDQRELSTNYELGLKYLAADRQREADVILFLNDYQNITGTCTASTGCSSGNLDTQINGGAAKILGVEARLAQGFEMAGFYVPVQLNLTYLNARFGSEFTATDGEWGSGIIKTGDPLPYVPDMQYTLSLGLEKGRFKQTVNIVYQGAMYSQSSEANRSSIPAFGIVDWNANYQWSRDLQLFAKADNILGKNYLVAYRPFGARPGKPQSFMAGLRASF